jgi:hypothetical protein
MRMHLRKLVAACALYAAAACASTGGGSTTEAVVNDPQGILTSDARGRQIRIDASGPPADSLSTSPDSAFRALVAAYGELGLATPLLETSSRRVGDPRMQVSRSLKGEPLSRFLSCGEGLSGPRANTDRIMLSVVSQVRPREGGGSTIETKVTAVAVDMGGRGGQAPCTSTGELEEILHRATRVQLGS